MKRRLLQGILAFFSKEILAKYNPDVIGITGTVGKTSTRDAVALVLASHFRIRASQKNFNTEIGVPLTIIGSSEMPRSVFGWMRVCMRAIRLLVTHDPLFPSILVLEMGADKPGDITYLTKLAPCKMGVLTAISPVHLEGFGTLEKLANEKREIYRHLVSQGVAILNADDPEVFPPRDSLHAKVISFGTHPEASVKAYDIKRSLKFLEGQKWYGGIECTIEIDGRAHTCSFPLIFRPEHLSCILAAVAVGYAYHIPIELMLDWLYHFQPPPGRSRLLAGIKNTLIIDDSYNSSPRAAKGAVDALCEFQIRDGAKHTAVLGDMKELGTESRSEHVSLGTYCASQGLDLLITVGAEAKYIAQAARDAGMDPEYVEEFDRADIAGRYLQEKIKHGDVVLVKGSQDVRLEKVVEEIMAEPNRAPQLLVRQEEYWGAQ